MDLDRLLRLARHGEGDERRGAVYELGDIKPGRASYGIISDCLLHVLETSKDELTRREAAFGLGQFATRRDVKRLVRVLNNERDGLVKCDLVLVLGRVGGRRATNALVKLLRDDSALEAVIYVLGKVGDRRAIKPLLGVLGRCDSENMRWSVFDTLEKITKRGRDKNRV